MTRIKITSTKKPYALVYTADIGNMQIGNVYSVHASREVAQRSLERASKHRKWLRIVKNSD